MGRECRRVPPGWKHPKENGNYVALHAGDWYLDALENWDEEVDQEHAPLEPDPADYMPVWTPEEATHYQMYENTSEGTPISPVFSTAEECARWCAENKVSAFADMTADYEWWLNVIRGTGGIGLMVNMGTGKASPV